MSFSVHSGCSFFIRLTFLAFAPSKATKVASLAAVWMTPPPLPPPQDKNAWGSLINFPSQFRVTSSSSVHAGQATYGKIKIYHEKRKNHELNSFYPSKTHAGYGSAQYVSNDRRVGLAGGKVRVKSGTVPMSHLIGMKFLKSREKIICKRNYLHLAW